MDSDKYRNVMRHQAGAVTIIAVGTPGRRTGLTATAVCSLTDSPPMVIACVNRNASAHAPIHSGQCFSINLLANDQNELARRFSSKKLEGEALDPDRRPRFLGPKWLFREVGEDIDVWAAVLAAYCVAQQDEVEDRVVFQPSREPLLCSVLHLRLRKPSALCLLLMPEHLQNELVGGILDQSVGIDEIHPVRKPVLRSNAFNGSSGQAATRVEASLVLTNIAVRLQSADDLRDADSVARVSSAFAPFVLKEFSQFGLRATISQVTAGQAEAKHQEVLVVIKIQVDPAQQHFVPVGVLDH